MWWLRCSAAFFALALTAGLHAQSFGPSIDEVAQLQDRFDHENDGVRKAKLLQRLGDAQFDRERAAAKSGDFLAVGVEMEKYRDNVRSAFELLKKTHHDAEKHSNGYRQLEIHVAHGIREARDVILAVPEPYRPPMQLVEQDLRDIDTELLRLLFPRRPGEQREQPPKPPQPSSSKPPAAPESQP